MTDTLIDHADSGEIPRLPGETRMRIDTGDATVRIDPRLINAPSYEAIPRRVIEIDDTVQFRIPETIGVVDFDGPQKPPPPLPKPKDLAETEQITLLTSLGADLPEDGDAFRPEDYTGRHRHPEVQDVVVGQYWEMQRPAHERRLSPWVLAAVVLVGLAMWAGLCFAATAVWAWLSGGVW
jgi:hypothetical protein